MPIGFTPIYRILRDGVDITNRFNDRTTSIKVELTNSGQQDSVNIIIDDRDFSVDMPSVGTSLQVFLGYEEVGLAEQGIFEINTITFQGPPREILITGTAVGFMTALKAPAIKDFENKSVKDIVEDIAKSAGTTAIVEQGLGEKTIPYFNQTTSPLHLLNELERRLGAVAKFSNGKLVFIPRDEGEDTEGRGQPILSLRPEHFGNWEVRHTQRADYAGVRAMYWDKNDVGVKWVEEALGDAGSLLPEEGESVPKFRMGQIFNSEQEAKDAARSQMKALNRALGEATIQLAKGDPWIRDQMRILISGMREGINGSYIIETARHTYTKDGALTTEIYAKPPGTGEDYTELDISDYYDPSRIEKRGDFFVGPGGRAAGPV